MVYKISAARAAIGEVLTQEEAETETKHIFGEDSFVEFDDDGPRPRYYVGACPTAPGTYHGFMGYSWEEALSYAKGASWPPR